MTEFRQAGADPAARPARAVGIESGIPVASAGDVAPIARSEEPSGGAAAPPRPQRLNWRRALAVAAIAVVLLGAQSGVLALFLGQHRYAEPGVHDGWGLRRLIATTFVDMWTAMVVVPVVAAGASLLADALRLWTWPARTGLVVGAVALTWLPVHVDWSARGYGISVDRLLWELGSSTILGAVLETSGWALARSRIALRILTGLAIVLLAALAVAAILVAVVPEPPEGAKP